MVDNLTSEELQIGSTYSVEWDDCCVGGHFEAKLLAKNFDEKETDFLDSLVFDNGVTLENTLFGFKFEWVDTGYAKDGFEI